jgi:hypothetical protein
MFIGLILLMSYFFEATRPVFACPLWHNDNDTCDFGNPQEGNLLAFSGEGQVVKKITIEVAIDTLTPGTRGRCSATCASVMSTSQSCRLCMAK